MRLVSAILGLVVFASAGLAQQTANTPETRSVIVNVLDRQGTPVRNLTKDNFVAHVNGKPVEVLDAHYSVAPRRIVVLLDVSGSMSAPIDLFTNKTISQGSFKWHVAREALDSLLTQTPQEVAIAVLTFARHIRDRFDFSEERAGIVKWSDSGLQQPVDTGKGEYGHLYDAGDTALYDAVAEGLKLLGRPQQGDCVYAITDGGDNASKSPLLQTKAALLQSGVRLFVLFPPGSWPLGVNESQAVNALIDLAKDSGGTTFGDPALHRSPFADGFREKVMAFTRALDARVSEFWVLQLAQPASNKRSKLRLEIADHNGQARNDVLLAYPQFLPAAK